jgi:hypothetical protein
MPDQLALAVDQPLVIVVAEARNGSARHARFGPLPEPQARELAGLLLNRHEAVDGPGPWRCAVAGGRRTVTLEQAEGGPA